MTTRRLPVFLALAAVLAAPAALLAQVPEETPRSFERKYIDASQYRADRILLYDWPALTTLVVWTRDLQEAVTDADQTLSAELLSEFRARVDSLRLSTPPDFLGVRADSVTAALAAIGTILDRAEVSLSALPETRVTPKPGAVSADPDEQRTIVTGSTAVTVPAGVAVGSERDSLPAVAFETGDSLNFVDLVTLALVELDRVVHLVRTAEAEAPAPPTSPAPAGRGARPEGDTPPPRPSP